MSPAHLSPPLHYAARTMNTYYDSCPSFLPLICCYNCFEENKMWHWNTNSDSRYLFTTNAALSTAWIRVTSLPTDHKFPGSILGSVLKNFFIENYFTEFTNYVFLCVVSSSSLFLEEGPDLCLPQVRGGNPIVFVSICDSYKLQTLDISL